MKKTTHKFSWLKACNSLLSGTLALLGYTSPMQWKSDETFPPQAFDTLQTDKDGNYLYQNEMTVIDRFRVVCEDPSGALKADSATIKMDPQGGEGWYQGSDSQEVDFELKKQEP